MTFRTLKTNIEAQYTNDNGEPLLQISHRHGSLIWIGFAFKRKEGLRNTMSRFVKTAFATGLLHHWDHESDHSYRRWGKVLAQMSRCKNEKELMSQFMKASLAKGGSRCTHWNVDLLADIVKQACIPKPGAQRAGSVGGHETYLHMVHLKLVFVVYAVNHCLAIFVFFVEFMLKFSPFVITHLNCCSPFCSGEGVPTIGPRIRRMVSTDSVSVVVPFLHDFGR